MDRRGFNASLLAGIGALASLAPAAAKGQGLRELVVAEPNHQIGYLPLYAAIRNGYFREEGLAVRVVTVESGAGHTNMVLARQAFAFIGGPEHNAYARAKGAELRAVVNCVNRGNAFLMARPGLAPQGRDFAAFVKGKRIATGPFGATPNSITRYLLSRWGLDPRRDVTLLELTYAGEMAAMKTRNADIVVLPEPLITQGLRQGLWEEPFYNVPRELGDYAYSSINVRKESIDAEPATVGAFVRAILRGLSFAYGSPAEAALLAKQEFPTMSEDDLKATLQRCYTERLWSRDGRISTDAWATAQGVVRAADLLKVEVPYEQVIDMRFIPVA